MSMLLPLLAAAASGCPARHAGVPLTGVTVFDGPVAEMASLVPDGGRRVRGGEESHWSVAYIYAAGRQVHLQCDYRRRSLVVRVSRPVARCTYTERGRQQAARCR